MISARVLALLWIVVVAAAGLHLAAKVTAGLPLQTDLMALLPAEDRDEAVEAAKARMTQEVSSRIALLVGHADRAQARAAATALRDGLAAAGVFEPTGDIPSADGLRKLSAAYFPYRAFLLADSDRQRLAAGEAEKVLTRALSQVFGVGGIPDARLLAADPFLLFPAFLSDLPMPVSRLSLDQGMPSVAEDGVTWVLVSGRMVGDAFALDDHNRLVTAYGQIAEQVSQQTPDLRLLRLGAVFYSEAATREALSESSLIGGASALGAVLMILVVFRSVGPLLLTLVATLAGLLVASSACLLAFGSIHVGASIFGASLIGISVDYSLHYFAQVFAGRAKPADRLRHVRVGLLLGVTTTIVGYGALALAPLPGLRQVAAFSAIGLLGAFATVVLWFPILDRVPVRPMPAALAAICGFFWRFWEDRALRGTRMAVLAAILAIAAWGATQLQADDDVRRQQSLNATLVAEQEEMQRIVGFHSGGQFFLISAADTDAALASEELLAERLAPIKSAGGIGEWRGPARFVPSSGRQLQDRDLIGDRLFTPHLASFQAATGLTKLAPNGAVRPLRLDDILATNALPVLNGLVLGEGRHIVALDRPADLVALAAAADGLDTIRFVDPTADLSAVLGAYRARALWLLAISAALMIPVLAWRYGLGGALLTLLPPVAAVVLTPAILAAMGLPFTFFGAMALVLVLSIGVDYALFCAETGGSGDPATILATLLATLTTGLAFGMLAFSAVAGVQSFGAVMLVGIVLALLFAPLAGRVRPLYMKGRS